MYVTRPHFVVVVLTELKAESLVEDRGSSKMSLSINKLLEVEEHIWSPMYGLKGNVDATVQVACHDGESDKNLVIPLELKTGNRDTNQAHRAQTALYTLLLSDRYGKKTPPVFSSLIDRN